MMQMTKKKKPSTRWFSTSIMAIYYYLLVVVSSSTMVGTDAAVCDDSQCLSDACLALQGESSSVAFPCADDWVGRIDERIDDNRTTTAGTNGTSYQKYTCCPPGYDGLSLAVLADCSTDACASPDGKGGSDCSADGFIHPMVCGSSSTSSLYPYPRKEPDATIYSPYVCCTIQPPHADNQKLLVAASIWTVLSGLTFLACTVLMAAILRSPRARAQGYNLYLVFLALPDALFNLFSLARNIVHLSGHHLSSELGGTVHALEWFHTAANMWLNAVIVYQVHALLLRSQHFVRTPPPSVRYVCAQAAGVYAFAAVWAAWSLVLLLQGQNIFSNTNAAWLTSKALMVGPPLVYVVAVCVHVWWHQLLPRQGRTRILSLYFLRVVIVFLLTWVPFLVLVDVTYYKTHSLWMLGLAYYFSSLQGLLSVVVAVLGKPDVQRAVTNFLCCRRGDEFNETEGGFLGSQANSIGKSLFGSVSEKFSTTRLFHLSRTSASDSNMSQRFGLRKSDRDEERAAPMGGHSTTIPSTGPTFHDASQRMSSIERERAEEEKDDWVEQRNETTMEKVASVDIPSQDDLEEEDGATEMVPTETPMNVNMSDPTKDLPEAPLDAPTD